VGGACGWGCTAAFFTMAETNFREVVSRAAHVNVFLSTDRHGNSVSYRDEEGVVGTTTAAITDRDILIEEGERLKEKVHMASLHLSSSLAVTERWTFDVNGDGKWWSVLHDGTLAIRNEGFGLLIVRVTYRERLKTTSQGLVER